MQLSMNVAGPFAKARPYPHQQDLDHISAASFSQTFGTQDGFYLRLSVGKPDCVGG